MAARPATQANSPDLRQWLSSLTAAGQLRHVKAKVDWDLEIGAISRVNLSQGGPALLFENIKDYESGRIRRLLTCGLGNREQVALLLGQPGQRWTADANRDIVRTVIDLFGVPRCMFASNFPVDSLCATFREIFDGFRAIVADFAAHERDALFRGNARRIYAIS